ncbi:MAG: WG repeat-containing protein [Oscillospiraceae bacterium]|nr:WG repeat-containing protein [Oscillospiraceae bacterium]
MKRLFSLFLLLCILFSACTPASPKETAAPNTEPTTWATTQPSTEPTVETTAPTTEPGPLPTDEAEPPTQAAVPQFIVQTDFSAYTEKADLEPMFTRPSDGSSETIHALTEPTTLYPFNGVLIRNYGYVESYRRGLIDGTGRIVVDPVYTDIYLMPDYATGSTLPFWILEQDQGPETEEEKEYGWGSHKYGLMSLDGTFALECKYTYIEPHDDRILCSYEVPDSEVPYFEYYDFEGNLCLSSQKFPLSKDRLYESYVSYGEGLYVVCLTLPPEEQQSGFSDHGYYFMTEDGELRYGPFVDASAFSEGFAVVSLPNGSETYLRKDGTLFSESYSYAGDFQNGYASVNTESGEWVDINTNGEIVTPGAPHLQADGSYAVTGYLSDSFDSIVTCYDENMNLLWETTCRDSLSGNLITRYCEEYNALLLINPLTGKQLSFPEYPYPEYIYNSTAPYIKIYTRPEGKNTTHCLIITEDLDIFADIDTQNNDTVFIEVYPTESTCSEGFCIRDKQNVTLYRSPADPVGTYTVGAFHDACVYADGTVAFTTDECTEFYDADGTLFFRYLTNTMDD